MKLIEYVKFDLYLNMKISTIDLTCSGFYTRLRYHTSKHNPTLLG